MKNKNYRNFFGAAAATVALASNSAMAGTEMMAPAPPIEVPVDDVVSGVLSLDANNHFVSYGLDVWQDGTDFGNFGFYPSGELAFALPNNFTGTVGFWGEVNDKGGNTIGGRIQEIDVWTGLAYTYEKFTIGVVYQEWFYGGDSEDILDINLSYDCFLSPSLTIHNRLGEGASAGRFSAGRDGTVLVFGVEHSIETGPVTLTFPASLGIFVTDGFHGDDAAGNELDAGIGYGTIGVNASLPLSPYIGDGYGEWDLHAGIDFVMTSESVIDNQNDNFFTGNFGLGLSF